MNAEYLRSLGAEKLIGGEFEKELVAWANGAAGEENSSEHDFAGAVGLSGTGSCGLPAIENTRTWFCRKADIASSDQRKQVAVVNTCAGIARLCLCTRACFES